MCVLSCFTRVWHFATAWTVACPAPLSTGFSRQEYWSGLPCPPPGHLPNPGIELVPLTSPMLAGGFFTTSTTWEAHPSADTWINTMWYSHTGECYLTMKRNDVLTHATTWWILKILCEVKEDRPPKDHFFIHSSQDMEKTQMSSSRWVDKENVVKPYSKILFSLNKEILPFVTIMMWSEISQSKKDKFCMIPLTWGIQNTQTRGGGGADWEFGVSRYKWLHIKQVNNKVLPYSIGNYI